MQTCEPFDAFVEELWQSIRAGEVAVFCGAGISLGSGLPLVHDFVGAVLDRLQASPEDAQAILKSALPFEAFVETLRMDSDISELLAIFALGAPNPTHTFLADLARAGYVRLLCTTNFDPHIEGALSTLDLVRDRDFDVLYRDEDLARVRDDSGVIHVVKVHGSIDDRTHMAITLQQVASRTLSEARRQVIDGMFAGGPHRRVLVLGYSCSDVFDLTPQIEAIAAGHREVIFVDHHRDQAEIRDLAQKDRKNPFRRFPASRWVLCDTDRLIASLAQAGGMAIRSAQAVTGVAPKAWERYVDAWAAAATAARPGMTAPGILGEMCYKLSNFEGSLRHYGQALDAARAAGDRQREGIYLGNLANNEFDLGRTAQATEHFEAAIAIARELGDAVREGMWLGNLGGVYITCADYPKAIDVLGRALAIAQERGDRAGQAANLGNLGHASYLTGSYEQASSYYQDAITIARELGDKHAEMSIVGSLGDTAHHLGDFQSALTYHEEALAAALHLGARAAESNWRGTIANDCAALGDLDRAGSELEQAIALARATGSRRAEAARLSDLGNVCQTLGEIDKAAALHEASLRIAREIGDTAGEGSALGNLGNASMARDLYAQAIDYYERATDIAARAGNRQLEGTWLGNLGAAYYKLGDFPRAVDCQQRSIELAAAIGDRSRVGNAEYNLGSVRLAMGQLDLAATHFRRALQIYTSLYGPDHANTRLARESVEKLVMIPTRPLFWLQATTGNVFELYTASGKRLVPVFTTPETALRVRALIVQRFPATLQICQALDVPRATFEQNAMAPGLDATAYLFVYEDSDEFPKLVAGLEPGPQQPA